MKAIVLEKFGDVSQLKLKLVDMPQPKEGEVKIQLKAAAFNPVDVKIRQGMYRGNTPMILGSDCSGIIDAVANDVTEFKVGDEVYALAFGRCSNGSYAEYLCLPSEFAAKKPKELSFEQAAALPIAALTSYRAMMASSAIKKGDVIFIAGAGGGVGSIAVQMAKLSGASTIFSVAGSEASSEFLQQELGLKNEHILLYHSLTFDQMLQRLITMNDGRLFKAAFDFVGGEMKRLCLNLVEHSGHFATIVPENSRFNFSVWERGPSLCFNRNLSLHFVFLGAEAFSGTRQLWDIYSHHLNHIAQLFNEGHLKPPAIKSLGKLSLETVIEAHRLLEEGRVKGKLVMSV